MPSWKTSPARLSTAKSSLTRADELVLRLEQHLVVGVVGDRAAGGQRRQPRAAPAAQHAVDGVVMDERAAPAAPGGEAFGQHLTTAAKSSRVSVAIGPGAAKQREELVLAPFLRRDFGDDLLRQHVERLFGNREAVELAAARRCRAAPRIRPARRATAGTAGPSACRRPHGPERPTRCRKLAIERGEPSWQTRSTSPMSMPSSSEAVATSAFKLAALQPLLGVEPLLLGQAAVMRGDLVRRRAARRAAG